MVKHVSTAHSVLHDNPHLPYLIANPHTHEDWLYERRQGVGASKCGVLLGCRMYETDSVYNLWREKIGLGKPVTITWPMTKGHILEDYVAKLFYRDFGLPICNSVYGRDIATDFLIIDKKKPFLRVSPDRVYWTDPKSRHIYKRGILEIKSSSKIVTPKDIYNKDSHMMWYCQLQYQMHVYNLHEGYLGYIYDDTYNGGDYWFEKVEYNKELCDNELIPAIENFWRNHVEPALAIMQRYGVSSEEDMTQEIWEEINVFAPDVTDAADVPLRYPSQVEGKEAKYIPASTIDKLIVDYDLTPRATFAEILDLYRKYRDAGRLAKRKTDVFESNIKLFMKDVESVLDEDGNAVITYKQNKSSKKFDVESFKEKHPELYRKFLRDVPGARILKIK